MHIYKLNDKDYPSVTTIIHALGNDGLLSWANYLGFKRINYEKELERSSNFGTLVHSHLQNLVDPNFSEPITPLNSIEEFELAKTISNFNKYISQFKYQTIYSEKTIISESLGYAGTIDWLCDLGKYRVLCDFKTSKTIRFPMMLQLGGYYNLLQDINEDVDYAAIMIVNPTTCKLNVIEKNDLKMYSDIFNLIAEFYLKSKWHTNPKPNIKLELENKLMS